MSFLQNPRLLFSVRCAQLGFAIGVLVLIAYANTHKEFWLNMDGPVALGGKLDTPFCYYRL